MTRYSRQTRMLVAVDCIIFGFDGQDMKLLLIQRAFEPEKGKWSLMGGFVQQDESFEEAASRVLKKLTGLEGVYMEQLHAFSDTYRDPIERTASVAFFSLIDINQYTKQISHEYHAEWFSLHKIPEVIFDHKEMIDMAREKLRYKAAIHPILFELLPEKFTLTQLQSLYEAVLDKKLDKRNFRKKMLSYGFLKELDEKQKGVSYRAAKLYKFDKRKYGKIFQGEMNLV